MTDNEVIKALECCSSENGKDDCLTCPNFKDFVDCKEDLSAIALDLINRQKAEIERLKGRVEATEISKQKLLSCFKTAKTEAIKEFAERLKMETNCGGEIYAEDIDNIAKYLTEQ